MKRLLALLLVALMIVSMAACGSTTEKKEKETQTKEKISFEEQTVIDTDECTVKIVAIDDENYLGYTLKASLENKSDKDLVFTVDDSYINGVGADSIFYGEVPAGKNSKEDITFMDDVLKENGIEKYTDIELMFSIHEEDVYDEFIFKDAVNIYPYGEDKAETFTYKAKDSDTVIVDNEYAYIAVIGYGHDDYSGYLANLYIENKSDVDMTFYANDVCINDSVCDAIFAPSVASGKCAFKSLSWSDDKLEENGIDEVETIEFTIKGVDKDEWSMDGLFSEEVTLNP